MNGSSRRLQAVATLLDRAVAAGLAPGAVAQVRGAGGSESCVAVGKAGVAPSARRTSCDVLYDLASLTKPLATATLFLLARREGLLALETTVGEVLDEAGGTAWANVTMVQLLTHTAGLPGWLPVYVLARGRRRAALGAILGTEPVGPPGGQVIYSCPGFLLLGWLLERVLERPLAVAFRELVCRPLGLSHELLYTPDPTRLPLAGGAADGRIEEGLLRTMGLEESSRQLPPVGEALPDDGNARFLGGVAGNAGLWGTAQAVAVLAAEYLPGGGCLLEAEETALATCNHTEGLEQARGLGWQLAATPGCSAGPALSREAFGHTGFTGTSVWVEPRRRMVFVLLTNRHNPAHRGVELHPLRRRFHTLAVAETFRSAGSSAG